jgi:small subunit ribosomal protein S18
MNNQTNEKKSCQFCVNNNTEVDYKDIRTIRHFVNVYKKILPKKRTGVCSWHQRKLSMAIKRARQMALLPFTNK